MRPSTGGITMSAITRPGVGYLRVSTQEQGRSGFGLAAQHNEIEALGAREGFSIKSWHQDLQTGAGADASSRIATVNSGWLASSMPRSQVSDRRKVTGNLRTAWIKAATTVSVRLSATLTTMTKRDCRSTSVAMQLPRAPSTRSPSQWPGTARSSASAGRCRIETASTISPRPSSRAVAWRERRPPPPLPARLRMCSRNTIGR